MNMLKLSLQVKFYLMVLPPVIILLALLIIIIVSASRVHQDIHEVRIDSAATILTEQFARNFSRQMKEVFDFILSGEPEDETQFEQSHRQATLALSQLRDQIKQQSNPEQVAQDSKLLDKIENGYEVVTQQARKLIDSTKRGKRAEAQRLFTDEMDSYVEGYLTPNIDKFRYDLESNMKANLTRLSAHLDQFRIITSDDLQSRIRALDANLTITSRLDRFAHSLINEIKEYAESVLSPGPEQEAHIIEAQLSTKAALREWQAAEELLDQNENPYWLTEITGQLKMLDSAGHEAIGLARNGNQEAAIERLEHGQDQFIDQVFYPNLTMSVADRERKVTHDLDYVGQSISRLSLLTIALSVFVVLTALCWPWFLSRRIIAPILMLQNFAREVGEGSLDGHVEIKSNDEMGSLAASFNLMVEKQRDFRNQVFHSQQLLQQANSELEGQVLSRTGELSRTNEQLQLELSKRLQTEEELLEAKTGLEMAVDERTAELSEANRQLALELEERRRAEDALKEGERRYRDLVDNSLGLICTHDLDGYLLSVNPAAASALGYTPEEMTGRNMEEFLSPGVRGLWSIYLRDITTSHTSSGLVLVETKAGEQRIWAYQNLVYHEPGKVPYVLGHAQDVTKLKQSEKALRESEEKFRSIVETTNEWVWEMELSGHSVYSNPAVEFILGYSPEEITSQNNFALMHEEDRRKVEEMWPSLTSEKRGWTGLIVRWRHRNGQYRYLESNAVPILNSSGELTGYRGSDRDITERLQAEEGLRRAEEYRNLFRLANDPIIVFEPEGEVVLDVNDKACEVYGIPRDSFIGMSLKQISQNVAKGEIQLKRLLEVGTYQEFESVQFRSDGTAINLLINASVIEYQGRVAVLSMNRDVTERKQAEYKLENSVSIIRATLEATADAILVVSNSGEVVTCNQKFLQMWQIADEEALVSGDQWMQQYALNQVKTPDAFLLEVETLLADPDAESWSSIEFRDGRVIEQYSQPQRINGQTVGRVWSFRDLSDRKNLEEQLRQSQKLEAVGQLAGGIAHDFNNLLTAIIGYSELTVSEVERDSYLHQSILEIRKAGERAASLTRQLLAFSRRQVMQPRVLDLNDVVVEMNRMLRRLIGENIDLVTALDPDLGRVKADPGQIEQVIINLVVNARDAMPKGGKVVIELSNVYLDKDYAGRHVSIQPGWYAMLAVSDTGCGMTAEVQKRVFEPFFTTKEVGKGTGLGLSTVFGIVKQSGGSIWVYSEIGKGTTFKVYLPLIERVTDKIEVEGERKKVIGGTESILLVEDEETVRRMTCTILAMKGYQVLAAANGAEALRLVEQHQGPIDLILTDVVMPKMDGSKLAEIIIRERPEARVLFMSGYTDDAIVHHGVLAEGIPFIEKPFTPRSLISKVRDVLDTPASANLSFRDGISD